MEARPTPSSFARPSRRVPCRGRPEPVFSIAFLRIATKLSAVLVRGASGPELAYRALGGPRPVERNFAVAVRPVPLAERPQQLAGGARVDVPLRVVVEVALREGARLLLPPSCSATYAR